MKEAAFHSSGRLDIKMLINRFRIQYFVFTAGGSDFDITNFNWQLNIKRNVGAREALLTLGMGTGLSFTIYETNELQARFEAAQVNVPTIQEGPQYWELVRTDTNEIWVSGEVLFKYGLLDSGGVDTEVTVNLSNQTVSVELQSIVQVTTTGGSSGGGGGFSLTDWPIASGVPTATLKGQRYYLIGTSGTILGEFVVEGTTMEARVDNPGSTRGNWYFNFGGT